MSPSATAPHAPLDAAPSTLVVGAGLMGHWHVHALRRLGIGVSGVVDPDHARARRLAGRASGCPTYPSLSEAVAAGGHRSAHVCTPVQTHIAIVEELLDAGMHALVEKPLAGTAQETRMLLERAERSGLQVCPVHQFLFQRGFRRTLEHVARAGSLLHVDAVAASAGATGGGDSRSEDVMADILPHPLSLMRRLLGSTFAETEWHTVGGPPGELRAVGRAASVSLDILVSMRARPTRNTLRLMCEGGAFHLDLYHGHVVAEPPDVSRVRKITRPFTLSLSSFAAASANLARRTLRGEPAYPGLRELVAAFHRAIRGGGPPITPDESIDVAVAREALLGARLVRP